MEEVWKTYDEYVKVSPANVQEFDKLKGKMMVGIAFLRAGMPDSAKAHRRIGAGRSEGRPAAGDDQSRRDHLRSGRRQEQGDRPHASGIAANPQQRALAATDKGGG